MNIPQIAIIGAGNIGSRHLQALSNVNQPIEIYVFDLNENSLRISKQRFEEVNSKNESFIKKVNYINNINLFPNELDVCIIATNSASRRKVLEEIISISRIKFLILEKFLFQTTKDFEEVGRLLSSNAIMTWVNCSRRIWPIYIDLSKKFSEASEVELSVSGSNIGIGCNGIHFIDLFEYLTNREIHELDSSNLKIIDSKREGYIDFAGNLIGKTLAGDKFSITSYESGNVPLLIEVNSTTIRFIVDEQKSFALISEKENNWKWEKTSFEYPYQSNLTHLVVQDLLEKSDCNLPRYNESSRMHLNLLKTFLHQIKTISGKEVEVCPIT